VKTEQSLLKTPTEPVAVLPSGQLSRVHARRHTQVLERRAPAPVISRTYTDVPPTVYATFIGCWAALVVVFWFTFAESPNAAFMVAISTALALMFFGVPIVLSRTGSQPPFTVRGLDQFLRGRVQTLTGPVNGLDALVQIVVVPVCLTIGAIAISLIINLDRMPN
jgi:type IV secretory pathway VirB2 component (pilin)